MEQQTENDTLTSVSFSRQNERNNIYKSNEWSEYTQAQLWTSREEDRKKKQTIRQKE